MTQEIKAEQEFIESIKNIEAFTALGDLVTDYFKSQVEPMVREEFPQHTVCTTAMVIVVVNFITITIARWIKYRYEIRSHGYIIPAMIKLRTVATNAAPEEIDFCTHLSIVDHKHQLTITTFFRNKECEYTYALADFLPSNAIDVINKVWRI